MAFNPLCQCPSLAVCCCVNSQWPLQDFSHFSEYSHSSIEVPQPDHSQFHGWYPLEQETGFSQPPALPEAQIQILHWEPPQAVDHNSATANTDTSSTSSRASRKRKEPAQPSAASRSKRPRTSATNPQSIQPAPSHHHLAAQTCGTGPSQSTPMAQTCGSGGPAASLSMTGAPARSVEPPANDILILTTPPKSASTKRDATDVYYFIRGLDTKEEPAQRPDKASEPVLTENPKTQWVGCKACKKTWQTWHNSAGITSTVRRHLTKEHTKLYHAAVEILGLKGRATAPQTASEEVEKEPFSVQGFEKKLVRWAAVDDQSLHVVDSVEFREMILFDAEHLEDKDIPHRTKLRMLIRASFNVHRADVRIEMQNALGRISFTADLWTDPIMRAFMAVTAHYIIRAEGQHLVLKAHLIAFKHIEGHHDGASLARAFFTILEEEGVTWKVGSITMDSATSNDTKMEGLEAHFASRKIAFDHNGNRVRCFPHSINRSVKAVLEAIKSDPIIVVIPGGASDPVRGIRDLVGSCRKSGERRADLQRIIKQGNLGNLWGLNKLIPELQLLRDCDTRWSSTFQMIACALTLYPAIKMFLNSDDHRDLAHLQLSSSQLRVLVDLHQVLQVPHAAQEVLSSSRTPTLSMALPSYELLITVWSAMKTTIPEMQQFIDAGIQRLEKYIRLARKTRIYALAMSTLWPPQSILSRAC
ncbi:hypothetical protein BN946_scf184970.g74 [Trametes cinnabarina]|uniref:BED-type domain-containing protein n=1 Tax=Pycnoporus cinnabarinus TaxID=5643 RepID=A0A060SCK8_PYCCI|nr:hypothetical protein BN946_scf184970.g74 [Trametes cinnabarina]